MNIDVKKGDLIHTVHDQEVLTRFLEAGWVQVEEKVQPKASAPKKTTTKK